MFIFREAIIISFALTIATPGLADPWAAKKYAAEGFQVEWSGPVKVSPTEMNADKRKLVDHATQYMQEAPDYAYVVNSQQNLYATKFDEGSKASFDTFHCKSVDERPFDINGIKAKEMVGTGCDSDFRIRARYFANGKWFYQVISVVTPAGDLDAGRHFVESFKLTGK